jgi:predicted NBD/HSP70 family sugar kinase
MDNQPSVNSMKLSHRHIKVLKSMLMSDGVTLKEIATSARLTPLVVTSLLAELEAAGIVERTDRVISGRGRPALVYGFRAGVGCALGIVLTQDVLRAVLIDFSKKTLISRKTCLNLPPEKKETPGAVVNAIIEEIRHMLALQEQPTPILCVGVAIPGMVDMDNGIWVFGHQIAGIENLHFRELLQKEFGIPLVIEDSVRTLTLFHRVMGLGRSHRNFVLLRLGWGVGSGIVIDGNLYRGNGGLAGEIGHLVVDHSGRHCTCGSVGCLETIISEPSVIRQFEERLKQGVVSALEISDRKNGISLADILSALQENDKLATSTIFKISTYIGEACSTLVKLFNPELLIVSGPVARLGAFLREPIEMKMKQDVMKFSLQNFKFVMDDYSEENEAAGAALLAIQRFLDGQSS